ncbi:MAG: MerR family transcriptional regulator [Ilumatobacteraceae bacterium]
MESSTSQTAPTTTTTRQPPATALTIGEASLETGVSIDTLRYYERVGVLPPIRRRAGRQRSYTADDLGWITFVRRLRATGMPVEQVSHYVEMVRHGDGSLAERRGLLEAHRDTVRAAVAELHEALEILDRKILHYEAAERGVDIACSDTPLRHVRLVGDGEPA